MTRPSDTFCSAADIASGDYPVAAAGRPLVVLSVVWRLGQPGRIIRPGAVSPPSAY
jgi:hypothetical protein